MFVFIRSSDIMAAWAPPPIALPKPLIVPKAKKIRELFGDVEHSELPYEWRTILNLAVNHKIQSSAATLMNRSAIAIHQECERRAIADPRWSEVRLVLQVHDELVMEAPISLAEDVHDVMKDKMETTTTLAGVDLIAEPKIAYNLADLK